MKKIFIIITSIFLLCNALLVIEGRYSYLAIFFNNYLKQPIDYTLRASTIDLNAIYENVSFKSYVTPENIKRKYDFETVERIYASIIYLNMNQVDYNYYFYKKCLLGAWDYLSGLGYPEDVIESTKEGEPTIVEVHPELYEVLCVPEEVRLHKEVYNFLKKESSKMDEKIFEKQVRNRVKDMKKKAFFDHIKSFANDESLTQYKVIR